MDTATFSDAKADLREVCRNLGKPLDPELVKRVQERSRLIRERVLRERGVLNVVDELIRELRDVE